MKVKQGLMIATSYALLMLATPSSAAGSITFVAGDKSTATKLCVSAVSNNLVKTKSTIRKMYPWAISELNKTRLMSDQVRCNGQDIVQFTATYGADKTFEYLNKRVRAKYRLDDNINITDLARIRAKDTILVVRAN